MRDIRLGDDILDSRDIEDRIKELEGTEERDECEENELKEWLDFREQAGDYEWRYGQVFILDSHFIEYAQELAEDIGAIGRDLPWPVCHIDWDAAADALKIDYTAIEVGGYTYWTRA